MNAFDFADQEMHDPNQIDLNKIPSRHSPSKEYRVYFSYNNELVISESMKNTSKWYCEYKNGNRTLGSCCHATTLMTT